MDLEELIIDRESVSEDSKLFNITIKICQLFKLGEWKKGLELTQICFSTNEPNIEDSVEIYKSGISCACKVIESKNIKTGIYIAKRLNKHIISLNPECFIQYQCEVLNYIACAYKQGHKLYLAKKYIDRAMSIIEDFNHVLWDKSGTYLNMCAILSAMGKHSEAITYAKIAITLSKEELVNTKLSNNAEDLPNKGSVLGIAYHNYAVEEEFLNNLKAAAVAYKKAASVLTKYAPNNTEMIAKFRNSYFEVRKMFTKFSRPNSAKSAVSVKTVTSTKSRLSCKSPQDVQTKPKTMRNKAKMQKNESEKEFSKFKVLCKDFLTSNREWYNSGTLMGNKVQTEKSTNTVSLPPTRKTRQLDSSKKDFTNEKAIIITAPKEGVENPRTPILHEVSFTSTVNQHKSSFDAIEEKDEISSKKMKRPPKYSGPSSKKNSFFKDESFLLQEFDEVKPADKAENAIEIKIEKIEDKPIEVKENIKTPNIKPKIVIKEPVLIQDFDEIKPIIKEQKVEPIVEKAQEPKKGPIQKQPSIKNHDPIATTSEEKPSELRKLQKLICRLQAHFRGAQAREKFKLLKARKSTLLFRGAKKFQNTLTLISIFESNNKKYLILTNGAEEQKINISEDLTPQEIIANLELNEKGQYIVKTNEKDSYELIKKAKLKISNELCEVKFLFDNKDEILVIKAMKLGDSSIYSLEKKISIFKSKPQFITYLHSDIIPYLAFMDEKLIISRPHTKLEYEFLAKGHRIMSKKEFQITANKILNDQGMSIEFIAECPMLKSPAKQVFFASEILECVSSLGITNLDSDPHIVFLPLQYQETKLTLRKIDKKHTELIHTSSSILNSFSYCVKVYKIQNDSLTYYFQAFSSNSPAVSSYSITDKDLSNIYKIPIKNIKPSIDAIVKSISIKSGKLFFASTAIRAQNSKEKAIPILLKLQAMIRGHLQRDRLKFTTPKGSLLYREEKHVEGVHLYASFYKNEDALVVELLCPILEKSFYLFINEPKSYFTHFTRIFDLKCIAGTISLAGDKFFLPTSNGNAEFIACMFYSNEEVKYKEDSAWPAFYPRFNLLADYYLLARELASKSLLVKAVMKKGEVCPFRVFTFLEIGELVGSYKPLNLLKLLRVNNGSIAITELAESSLGGRMTPNGEKILYRACKSISGKLYQVTLSISEKCENDNEEILTFTLRQGSMANLSKVFRITTNEACQKTGFSRSYLIPMADYMIRHLLIIQDGEIVLDETKASFDINKAVLKIQSMMRGYMVRKNICKNFVMKFIYKTKIKLKGKNFTILFYLHNREYEIFAVNGFEVYSLILQKSLIEANISNLEKFFASKVVPKLMLKEKNNKIFLGGLKSLKKRNSELNTKKGILNTDSSSSIASPRTFRMTGDNPQVVKSLKWRAPWTLGEDKCLVTMYEIGDKGLVEVLFMNSDRMLSLEVKKNKIDNPQELANKLIVLGNSLIVDEATTKRSNSGFKLF